MALGSIAGSIAGGLASGAAGAGINRLFGGGGGGDIPQISDILPNFDTPAIRQRFQFRPDLGGFFIPNFTLSDPQLAGLADFRNISGRTADELGGLRAQLRPGFGALTEARVNAIESNRERAVGSLRENLRRRRVLGSSFAGDALSRAEAEFAQEEADARARSFLEELDASVRLLNNEAQTRLAAITNELSQRLAASEIGATLISGVNASLGRSAVLNQQLAAESAAGRGAFFEPIVSGIGDAVGRGVSSFFNSGFTPGETALLERAGAI